MKKVVVAVTALMAVIVMSVVMAACTSTSFEGTYKFYSMTMKAGGATISYEVGQVPEGAEAALTEDYCVLTANADGTFSLITEGDTITGTWTVDGNNLSLTAEGTTIQGTLNGNSVTISETEEDFEMTMVLKK